MLNKHLLRSLVCGVALASGGSSPPADCYYPPLPERVMQLQSLTIDGVEQPDRADHQELQATIAPSQNGDRSFDITYVSRSHSFVRETYVAQ